MPQSWDSPWVSSTPVARALSLPRHQGPCLQDVVVMLEVLTQLWLHLLLEDEPCLNITFAWPRWVQGHGEVGRTLGRWRGMGKHGVYRIPGCFGPSQSTTTLKQVLFQGRLMSECSEVSRDCQISMVMEEKKKDQHVESTVVGECTRDSLCLQQKIIFRTAWGQRRHHSKLE